MLMTPTFWGWSAVVGAIICFGTFSAPIKSRKVIEAKVDPLVYQSYKSFWTVITSVLVFTYNKFAYTPWGIVAGFMWVPIGSCAVIAVNCIGLGVAVGYWASLTVIVSFLWGSVVFKESIHNWGFAYLGIGLLVIGIIFMSLSSLIPVTKIKQTHEDDPLLKHSVQEQDPTILPQKELSLFESWSIRKRRIVGYFCATLVGTIGASVPVPFKMAEKDGIDSVSYIFSFGVGVAIANPIVYALYSLFRIFYLKSSAPSFQFRVMLIPGSISGILWAIANFLTLYGILYLGQAIAQPCIQSNLLVTGMWGIIFYRELHGIQIVVWIAAAIITLAGVAFLSQA